MSYIERDQVSLAGSAFHKLTLYASCNSAVSYVPCEIQQRESLQERDIWLMQADKLFLKERASADNIFCLTCKLVAITSCNFQMSGA